MTRCLLNATGVSLVIARRIFATVIDENALDVTFAALLVAANAAQAWGGYTEADCNKLWRQAWDQTAAALRLVDKNAAGKGN